MAESEAAICNIALGRVGHNQFIDSLDEATAEAEACERLYPGARDEVLEELDWPFARTRVRPSPILETTLALGEVPPGWSYAFAYPSEAIPNGIRRIHPGAERVLEEAEIPFGIEWDTGLEANVILTNIEDPEIVFTRRMTETVRFAASFDSCVAWRLAPELARALRKDEKVAVSVENAYARALGTARAAALRGVRPGPEPTPAHIAAR